MTISLQDMVRREVITNASYLIDDLNKLVVNADHAVIKELSFDVTDLEELRETKDYETPAREKIDAMGRAELIEALDDAAVEDDRDAHQIAEAAVRVHAERLADGDMEDLEDVGHESWVGMSEEALREKLCDALDEFDDGWQEFCDREGIDPDYDETYEFWAVTDWFGDKLRAKGCVVRGICNLTVWGRGTTGQAISMDYVVQQIYKDLVGDDLIDSVEG